MRSSTWLILAAFTLALSLALGCSREPPTVPRLADAPEANGAAGDKLEIREPVTYANLTIFPIVSNKPKQTDRFITLDEGLKAGTVDVTELNAADPNGEAVEENVPNDDPFSSTSSQPVANQPTPSSEEAPFGIPLGIPRSANHEGQTPFQARMLNAVDQQDSPADESQDNEQVAQQSSAQGDDPFGNVAGNHYAGASVNELLIHNRSDKPLYLMPGEVLLGGQQDRTIAEEFVIQPGQGAVKVPVFCVEHGRWHGREEAQTSTLLGRINLNTVQSQTVTVKDGADDLAEVAKAAKRGKFVASIGSLNAKARAAVQAAGDQQAVWEKVAEENAKSKAQTESDTFAANYVQADAAKRLDPYLERLLQPVADVSQVVGVVVAVNGKPQSIDVFESTPLFKKLWPKLLKSYALDAANGESDEPMVACTLEAAKGFFAEAAAAKVEESESSEGIAFTRRSSPNLVSFSAEAEGLNDAAAGAAGGMAGFGGGVHSSAFAH